MKLKLSVIYIFAFYLLLISCQGHRSVLAGNRPKHTKEAKFILKKLNKAYNNMTPYFGHQDDLLYGQSWTLERNDSSYIKSDTYSVCKQYPFIFGIGLGGIELKKEYKGEGIYYNQIREAVLRHYKRGGIISASWHMHNPITGGLYSDVSEDNVVHQILTIDSLRIKFLDWLGQGAKFIDTLVDEDGKKIPLLFRPFHECNISGFWWSGNDCTDEDYIKLWKLVFDFFVNKKKMYQLIWVYSPYNIQNEKDLQNKYPGDEVVDIIGYERYQLGAKNFEEGSNRFVEGTRRGIEITNRFARNRSKIVAFTETGFPGIPYKNWWTETLGKAIAGMNIAYIMTWRNAHTESHYHGPCPKSKSSEDFCNFILAYPIKMLE